LIPRDRWPFFAKSDLRNAIVQEERVGTPAGIDGLSAIDHDKLDGFGLRASY
jgi:hypothetical protein